MGVHRQPGRRSATYLAALASLTVLGAAACGSEEARPPVTPAQTAAASSSPAGAPDIPVVPTDAGEPIEGLPNTTIDGVPTYIGGVPDPGSRTSESTSGGAQDGQADYRDGSYSAEGAYVSPGGNEHVGVELRLAGDVVTAVTVTPMSNNPNGQFYQGEFAAGIAAEVVGKDIDTLDVHRVGGSSLTSGGFADALEQIKADARS